MDGSTFSRTFCFNRLTTSSAGTGSLIPMPAAKRSRDQNADDTQTNHISLLCRLTCCPSDRPWPETRPGESPSR